MATVLIVLALLALVALGSAGCNAIAHGRRPLPRGDQTLRAEDALWGARAARSSSTDPASATQYDRKVYDLSGLGGF